MMNERDYSEELKIGNPGFFIANVMKDCPAHTVIRELLQNAIEASAGNRIEWFRAEWGGVPKLGLYNEGAGMDYLQLEDRMNIASSGKTLAFNANFGQGAKMSGGKASPYGLVYRSCKDGEVSQVWLQVRDQGENDKVLVKVAQYDVVERRPVTVLDVTAQAEALGRSLSTDWTEAILLGRSAEDNTLSGEFLGEKSKLWLVAAINRRYYAFPPGVKVQQATVTTDRSEEKHVPARGLASSIMGDLSERTDEVKVDSPGFGPIRLVYGKLKGTAKSRGSGGPLAAVGLARGTHICLIYQNEVYDYDQRWYNRAGAFGFTGVSEDYYVHIRLADDAPVRNNNHRTEVITRDVHARALACDNFAGLVRDNRPQWVLDDILARQQQRVDGRIDERLRRLAQRLKAKMDMPAVSGEGPDAGLIDSSGNGNNNPNSDPPEPDVTPRSRHGHGTRKKRPEPGTLTALYKEEDRDPAWYEEIEGCAGRYEKEANIIWLSRQFIEYRRLREWVEQTWLVEEEQALALHELDEEYRYHAAAYGLSALSLRSQKGWSPNRWEEALTDEAISCRMLDVDNIVQARVKQSVRQSLNSGVREREQELAGVG